MLLIGRCVSASAEEVTGRGTLAASGNKVPFCGQETGKLLL